MRNYFCEPSGTRKGAWSRLVLFALASLLVSLTSCSEADDTTQEYANWKSKNETYFEAQYQAHLPAGVIRSITMPDTLALEEIPHTDCILVDVLEQGTGVGCPLYTDSVQVHYKGHLIPSPSYAEGLEFDSSYTGTFDPATAAPMTFGVSSVVEGFSTALQHMHVGDHWRVTIPYQLGYGESDYGSIPGHSTLIFEIRLVSF